MSVSVTELTHAVNSPGEISAAAAQLRQVVSETEMSPNEVMTVFESWAKKLDSRELDDLPGIPFLRMWLRRGTLEPIIHRELGSNGLHGGWTEYGRAKCKAFPVGVDGAMIWGGEEAVLQIRALPFPHWARVAVFGPRISVAAMDAGAWGNPEQQKSWCLRLARDVWQFDQQACSSPQVLFLETKAGQSAAPFLSCLQHAFEAENQAHPRRTIPSVLTSGICQARASWLLNDAAHQAVFPMGPDWTLLIGSGSDIPQPTQGKTLTVLEVDDLLEAVSKFDGNVQTLGLGISDAEKEAKVALLAGKRGVDRVVKLGRMHVFVSPWDGMDLIRPMVRMVRHVHSAE